MGEMGENGGPQWEAFSRAKENNNNEHSKANIHPPGRIRPIAHLRLHPFSFPILDLGSLGREVWG